MGGQDRCLSCILVRKKNNNAGELKSRQFLLAAMALRGPCLPSVGSVLAVLQAAEDVQTRRVGWFVLVDTGFT